ncbi:marvel domain-containing protein [Phaeosphaeriaceae sp. PMI808]|nr:marvel domain-containing protein [Phaeosphaeriaceae sp. PMI808]
MSSRYRLFTIIALRGLQIIFAMGIINLSITLIKEHNAHANSGRSRFPITLPAVTAIGILSLVAAVSNFFTSWTNFLYEYMEMIVDAAIIMMNIVGGTVMTIRLQGKDCHRNSSSNRVRSVNFPNSGALGYTDILNGGCANVKDISSCYSTTLNDRNEHLNACYMRNKTTCVLMFLTAVVVFISIVLTYLRRRSRILEVEGPSNGRS